MLGLSLLFIGAVLCINGIGLTGRIPAKDNAVFNLLVGLLSAIVNLVALTRASETSAYLSIAAGLLFTFTYLYLFFVQWYSLPGKGLGWYCLFVVFNAIYFVTTSFGAGQVALGLMWLGWLVLWFLFFLSLALDMKVPYLAGFTIFIGITTCAIPGLMLLTGNLVF